MFYILLLELAKENILLAINIEIQLENKLDKYKVKKILDTRTSIEGQ